MTTRELSNFISENKRRSREVTNVLDDHDFDIEWAKSWGYERNCYDALMALNRLDMMLPLSSYGKDLLC